VGALATTASTSPAQSRSRYDDEVHPH
jgi:hypothetical protein